MKRAGTLAVFASLLVGTALLVAGTVYSIRFEQNCEGYLKRAADANTIALARQELAKAVKYIEDSGLTTGSTHVFYATPDCDLEFWYTNLKASLTELESLPSNIDPLTSSNQLLKLRETIMDQGEKGTSVTDPPSVHLFPHQAEFTYGGIGVLTVLVAGLLTIAANSQCNQHGPCSASSE